MTEAKGAADIPLGKLIAIIGIQAGVFVGLGLTLWWFSGRAIEDFVTFAGKEWLFGIALGAVMSLVAYGTFIAFPRLSDKLVRMQGANYAFLKDRLPPSAIVWISICAGVGEEALFRAGLQTFIADYTGVIGAIVVSSAIFAIVHMAKPLIAVLIFLIGALFGTIYWQTGSLLIVMIGHALYDVFALYYLQRRLHELDFFGEPEAVEQAAETA